MKRFRLIKRLAQTGLAFSVLASTGCSMMFSALNDDYTELSADPFADEESSAADSSEELPEFDLSAFPEEQSAWQNKEAPASPNDPIPAASAYLSDEASTAEEGLNRLKPMAPPEFELPIASFEQPEDDLMVPFPVADESDSPAVQEPAVVSFAAIEQATFRAAEPRIPPLTNQDCPADCPPGAMSPVRADYIASTDPQVHAYPDEFIIDGGDRDDPVHYFGGEIAGVDTEDTIAEFSDSEGNRKVRASNRVAVYAPRFGSVRTVEGAGIDVKVDKVAGAKMLSGFNTLNESKGLSNEVANLPAVGMETREGAGGVNMNQQLSRNDGVAAVGEAVKVNQRIVARVNTGMNTLRVSDMLNVDITILGAETSSKRTITGLAQASSAATQVYGTFRAQETVGVEKEGRPGDLQISKEASPLVAKADDVITFKIHFRNTGDKSIKDVRIIDNLTPRLVYVNGTGQISASNESGGKLSVVPNKEGSQLLEFRLEQPLRGGETGTITFKARVR